MNKLKPAQQVLSNSKPNASAVGRQAAPTDPASLATATRTAVRELRYAAIATAITIALAAAAYITVPVFIAAALRSDPQLQHVREFQPTLEGGVIRYRSPTNAPQSIAEYAHDLEILERRFRRGQFSMVLMPADVNDSIQAMTRIRNEFDYRVVRGADAAELQITPRSPAARAALHAYLATLERYWRIGG